MVMTLNDYIVNPMGRSNSVISAASREVQRSSYLAKFNQVLLRENGNIEYHCYYDEKPNIYWFHCKVPSEHVKKFYYDVVFRFSASAENGTSNNLFKWNVRFYSNDPAFVYTYAYAFNQKELFINELRNKMSKTALTTPSKEKNPTEMVGYCKIIYFAYLVMQNRNLNKLNLFKANTELFNPRDFVNNIDGADNKIQDRQSQKVSYAKKKTVSEDEYRRIKNTVGGDIQANIRTTAKVNKVSNVTSRTGSVKRVGNVGRVVRKKR